MSRYRQFIADGAGRYANFAEFLTQVVMAERMMYGWVDDKFYQLWPGGRCIEWTALVKPRQERTR